jgi:hypothetical protein
MTELNLKPMLNLKTDMLVIASRWGGDRDIIARYAFPDWSDLHNTGGELTNESVIAFVNAYFSGNAPPTRHSERDQPLVSKRYVYNIFFRVNLWCAH